LAIGLPDKGEILAEVRVVMGIRIPTFAAIGGDDCPDKTTRDAAKRMGDVSTLIVAPQLGRWQGFDCRNELA